MAWIDRSRGDLGGLQWLWRRRNEWNRRERRHRGLLYRNVQSTPAIADVDADGLPEVVTVAYPAGTTGSNMLIMLNGEDGSEELMIPDSTYNVRWGTGAAVGNLDGDAELEIVFMTKDRDLVVIEHDGTEKWTADVSGGGAQGYPAIANLDSDPEAEVVIGGKWFDNDGTPMQDKGWIGCNGEWCITAVADSNDDGRLDIVSGNKVYNADGTLVWENTNAPDGFVAMAARSVRTECSRSAIRTTSGSGPDRFGISTAITSQTSMLRAGSQNMRTTAGPATSSTTIAKTCKAKAPSTHRISRFPAYRSTRARARVRRG